MIGGPRSFSWTVAAALALLLPIGAAGAAAPPGGTSNSARYRFEANRKLSLDLAVADVRADVIKFEWPATLLGVKTGYKATIKIVNDSSRQAGIGLAVALYDQDGRLVGAGTTGSTLGTVDPGATAEFSVDFNHVTQRLEQAAQFQITLETR